MLTLSTASLGFGAPVVNCPADLAGEAIGISGTNICDGVASGPNRNPNIPCLVSGTVAALEQAATDVTVGYVGTNPNTAGVPITKPFYQAGLCPVNVHWHLGAEHRSAGQYDENGLGPINEATGDHAWTGDPVRMGNKCYNYDSNDQKFTAPYTWKYCPPMEVGQTYEIHWPSSAVGACGTPNQYQSPFYDGVFCNPNGVDLSILTPEQQSQAIGVQAQVFTIVNDEAYYYPDLMRGMLVDGTYGQDIASYTGSTTGTSRDDVTCSPYTPITWQVDRKCNLISASSFDKLCADMKGQRDNMEEDMHAHGARLTVADNLASDNMVRK